MHPPAEDGREQGEGCKEDETDGEHHPHGDRAEGGDGHDEDGGEADDDRQAAEEDGLAGGIHGGADGRCRVIRGGVQRCPEAGNDEEGVIDAQSEREHHREVEGPDGEVGEAGHAVEDAHRGDQPRSGQHEGKAGGRDGAECEHKDDGSDRPGEEFGLEHAFAVFGVEAGPECRRAGEGDRDVAGRKVRDGAFDTFGGPDRFGRVDQAARLEHDRVAIGAHLGRGGGRERGFSG